MLFVGIDVGNKGAIALINKDKKLINIYDCPIFKTTNKKGKKKTRVDSKGIFKIFYEYADRINKTMIEHAQVMPGQGISSGFIYGEGYGKYLGVLDSLGLEYEEIKPTTWKKYYKLNRDKNLSIEKAIELVPESKKLIYLKKHDGRAEALLIALYCLDNYNCC